MGDRRPGPDPGPNPGADQGPNPATGPDPGPNPGIPLDAALVREVRVDAALVRERVAAIRGRLPSGLARVGWLLRAVSCLDLTALAGDDTAERVRRLCRTARRPLPGDLADRLRGLAERRGELGDPGERAGAPRGSPGWPGEPGGVRVAAVCVYPALLETALGELHGSGIPVASVAGGFPSGLTLLPVRVAEVRAVREAGAREIDVVIARRHALTGAWEALYEEVRAFREAAGETRLKVILATGELGSPETVARASLVCLMAGADFLKTSTGKEKVNATLPAGVVMAREIRRYRERAGHPAGLKPAGGISRASSALEWLALAEGELGTAWRGPGRFRIGASSLLQDLVEELRAAAAALRGATPAGGGPSG